jgi:uncharacterized glyoxalase superfamily protein PhnB
MNFKSISASLMVDDVNQTVDYYEKILGFERVLTYPAEGRFEWAMMKAGDSNIQFQSPSFMAQNTPEIAKEKMGGSIVLYIHVEGIRELYDRIWNSTLQVKDIHTTFYGVNEFSIKDVNGYTITFAEAATRENAD